MKVLLPKFFRQTDAFTLIELLIVMSLFAFTMIVAYPNFNISEEARVTSKLGQLATDVRSSFDQAVLSGKTYRLVFHLGSGDYWLQATNSDEVLLGDKQVDRDLSPEEEKADLESFERDFAEYETLLGETFVDPATDEKIFPSSPILKARSKLRSPQWFTINEGEWKQKRSLAPELIIKSIQAEHHERKVELEPQRDTFAYIYILPSGYIEKAVIHIYYRDGTMTIDERKPPYTIITDPYGGSAKVVNGYEEYDFKS
jgi:prepilin-type N-terminal cleavage/methylation domain-containing protein